MPQWPSAKRPKAEELRDFMVEIELAAASNARAATG